MSASDVQIGGDHYRRMAIQPLEFIMANRLPFPEGAIIQYVCRWQLKGGIEDLQKARHLLDWMIEHQEKEKGGPQPPERDEAAKEEPPEHSIQAVAGTWFALRWISSKDLLRGASGAVMAWPSEGAAIRCAATQPRDLEVVRLVWAETVTAKA